jgi:hypothetical protein
VIPARFWVPRLPAGVTDAGYNTPLLTGIIPQSRDCDIRRRKTDLYQAKFFPITMKAVGFRIDCHAINGFDLREQLGKLHCARDQIPRQ